MDIEEFVKQEKPSGKRSILEPFKAKILTLKKEGYADWQVKNWLASNGISISRQAIQQFIKKNQGTGNTAIETNTETKAEPQNTGQTTQQNTTEKNNETAQTNLPLTGFHAVVANIAEKNSSSDPRRND